MVHTNKVLTVSYGTFSCTLEGFDDSFGTMKAIAEYFRDLASDDRYFGAEPPQPDADMLARIAQREITRRVEAHSTDTGSIILRATDNVQPMPEAITEAAPEVTPEPVVEVTPQAAPEPTVDATPEPVAEPTMESEVISEPIAELQIERTEVTETPETPKTTETVETVVVSTPVASAPVVSTPTAIIPPVAEDPAEAPEPAEEIAEVEVAEIVEADEIPDIAQEVEDDTPKDDPFAAATIVEPAVADIAAEVVSKPEPEPIADSIAAKLQRIRAVVSQNESLDQTDDYTEDQHADGFVAKAAEEIEQSLNDDDFLDSEEEQGTDIEILHVLNALDSGNKDNSDDKDIGQDTDDAEEDLSAEQIATPDTGEVDIELPDEIYADEAPVADTALFDDQDDTDQEQAAAELDDDDIVEIAEAEVHSAPVAPVTPAAAHVAKVKRADLEAALASGQIEQVEEDEEEDIFADQPVAQDSSLSPEDEADLMRELAAVEDELENGADESDNIFGDDIISDAANEDETDFDAPVFDAPDHTTLPQGVSEDETDLSRLMTEADEKLDDPEISSRHETYSQLRAAVASAEAERSAGGSIGGQVEDDPYRDDLADVVRPRRPSVEGKRTQRRISEGRPAPLKLVAEQRVDDGAGIAHRGPVRPRRVMTVPIAEAFAPDAESVDSAFAEFAIRMEATELPDLLEAAAAYLTFVEGHDKFSRPQLMSKVRLIKQDDYNREDGLRSFGQLLRDGKIVKRGGGWFAASEDIGFRPDPESDDAREVG